jgi:class 3 adenylate cyclase
MDATVDRGALTVDGATYSQQVHGQSNSEGVFRFSFTADWDRVPITPGIATVQVVAHLPRLPSVSRVLMLTVIGPPASITIAASPTAIACGEVSTITVTVKDAIGQNVGDGHPIRLWTNVGGRLAPPVPVTWGGVAMAFLLTSRLHEGPYAVICEGQSLQGKTAAVMAQVTVIARRLTEFNSIDAVAHAVRVERPDLSAVMPRGTVTILFTDIVDSTIHLQNLGDKEWVSLLHLHNDAVRREIRAAGGTEVKTIGDAFMAVFSSALDAVDCALGIQRAIGNLNSKSQTHIEVRAGLATGEPISDGGDFFGRHVTLASRIAGSARPGEVLLPDVVKELVSARGDLKFGAARQVALKGFEAPFTLWPVEGSAASPNPPDRP